MVKREILDEYKRQPLPTSSDTLTKMEDLTLYLHRLLTQGDYETARKFVLETLDQEIKDNTATTIRQIELYGFLIDIGCDTSNDIA